MKKILILLLRKLWALREELTGFWKKFNGHQKIKVINAELINATKVCIYYSFQRNPNKYIKNQLQDIKSRGFSIIYVTNAICTNAMEDFLTAYVDAVIERPNFGRDIAGYKAGYDFIVEKNIETIEDLLFTNDTIIYPIINADKFWNDLYFHKSIITGAYVSYQISRHVQSYFFLCKNGVCYTEGFRNFWRQYKCRNSRQAVILDGEIGFSKWMIDAGFDIGGIIDIPIFSKADESGLTHSILPKSYLMHFKDDIERLLNNYEALNPSHIFSLWSIYECNIPFVKKDLLSRGTFSLVEFHKKLSTLNLSLNIDECEIVSELLVKGLPSNLSLYQKIMNKIGAN